MGVIDGPERFERGNEAIARILTGLGLEALPLDGWVYVKLADGGALCISAEYGQSLEATVYPGFDRVTGS